MNPIVIIPARMSATRLPGKPLAEINGLPMILHVRNRAIEAEVGRVVVAAGEQSICDVVRNAGGEAILTNPELPSGSDRIFAALEQVDPGEAFDTVVNLQGDLPTLDPTLIHAVIEPLSSRGVDIGTLAAKITDPEEEDCPDVVKVVMSPSEEAESRGRALYFTRANAPWGQGDLLHHIGIYAYRRDVLKKFVQLKPSFLEKREKLEQLRALENNIRIDVSIVDTVPLGVDTQNDLDKARLILSGVSHALV
ncbi:MAG: 3-deoxy-manno-octulosonate cytidylyltransferase [Pseudomonadota bacterium]